MDTKVAVVGRAIKAKIDAKRNRSPCWVVLSTVEADLENTLLDDTHMAVKEERPTLFAGLVFSFSKILRLCCLDAKAMMNSDSVASGMQWLWL